MPQRGLVQAQAHQQHRVVARECPEVVFQQDQAQPVNGRIGGIGVHHVHIPALQGCIGQAVVEATPGLQLQAVSLTQPGPTVRAGCELCAEAGTQCGLLRRGQGGQVADPAQAQLGRPVGPHGQGVAVVEAQRHPHLQAARGQPGIELGQGGL